MKNLLCTLFLLGIAFTSATATGNIRYGIKAGANITFTSGSTWDYHLGRNIQSEEIYGDGASFGYAIGGFLNYYHTKTIGYLF